MDGLTERKYVAVDEDRVRAALTSIGVHARTANLDRADRLDDALSSLESGSLTGTQREVAVRSAHQLAGSAGTFGLGTASRLASWFERFFSSADPTGKSELGRARIQLAELRTRLDDPPDLG